MNLGCCHRNSDGAALAEYVLLISLVAVLFISGYQIVRKSIIPSFLEKSHLLKIDTFTGADHTTNHSAPISGTIDPQMRALERKKVETKSRQELDGGPIGNLSLGLSVIIFIICLIFFHHVLKKRLTLRGNALKERKNRLLGESGAILTEFVLVLPILLLLLFGIFQLTLIMTAKQLVDYAAYCACRSALVYIPDDQTGKHNFFNHDDNDKKFQKMKLASAVAMFPVCPQASKYSDVVLPSFVDEYCKLLPGAGSNSDICDRLAYAYRYSQLDVDFQATSSPETAMIKTTVTLKYPLFFPFIDIVIADGSLIGKGAPYYVNISSMCAFQNTEGFKMRYK